MALRLMVKLKNDLKSLHTQGHLVGSFGRPCDSWSWGPEFEPHIGCRDHLKKKKKKVPILNGETKNREIAQMWLSKS